MRGLISLNRIWGKDHVRLLGALALVLLNGCSEGRYKAEEEGPLREPGVTLPTDLSLPPISEAGNNATRIYVSPTFSDFEYIIDLAPQPKNCLVPRGGTIEEVEANADRYCRRVHMAYHLISRVNEAKPAQARQWHFEIPVEEWRSFIDAYDERVSRWRGLRRHSGWTDGTSTGVEWMRDGRLMSLQNNLPGFDDIDNPAAYANEEVHRLLLAYGPSGSVPRAQDWTVTQDSGKEWPCAPTQFNVPDQDGLGAGSDDCATFRRTNP